MNSEQLRDEAVADRVRQAQDFLDPSTLNLPCQYPRLLIFTSGSIHTKLQIRNYIDAAEIPAETGG
jgi:hypothetical protein